MTTFKTLTYSSMLLLGGALGLIGGFFIVQREYARVFKE
jgi:hypothetical protein